MVTFSAFASYQLTSLTDIRSNMSADLRTAGFVAIRLDGNPLWPENTTALVTGHCPMQVKVEQDVQDDYWAAREVDHNGRTIIVPVTPEHC